MFGRIELLMHASVYPNQITLKTFKNVNTPNRTVATVMIDITFFDTLTATNTAPTRGVERPWYNLKVVKRRHDGPVGSIRRGAR